MADVNDSAIPKGSGIVTFEMLYRAISKIQIQVKDLEQRIIKLEITPKPVVRTEAIGRHITEKKVK